MIHFSSSILPTQTNGRSLGLEFCCITTNPALPRIRSDLHFMMTQEDIQLNSAPSVITVNQTPGNHIDRSGEIN